MRQAMQRKYMQLQSDVFDVSVDWGFVAKFHVDGANAPAADTTSVLAVTNLSAAVQTITTGITNPATPRNLQVVGNAVGIVGNVVVTGTAYDGKTITETFALNGNTAVVGSMAFREITSISLPAYTNGATNAVSIGLGDAMGLPFKLSLYKLQGAWLNAVAEVTAPTFTTDDANIENNTVTLASALDGTNVDIWLML